MSIRVFGGVGAGLALSAAYYYQKTRSNQKLSVVSWNVLAAPFTIWEAPYHRNPAGKIAKPGGIETVEQTRARYTRAGAVLLQEKPHVVLLQECESAFFNSDSNKHADALLKKYTLHPCFGKRPDNTLSPGTVVLLQRDVATAVEELPRCVGGSDATGGTEKVCSVVEAIKGGKSYTFASCHFTWDGAKEQREHHTKLLEPELANRERFVLGGDFNAAENSLVELQGRTWLKDHDQAKLQVTTGTFRNMRIGENETIDHFFVSKGMPFTRADTLLEPGCPYGEGSPAAIAGPSDHVPLRLHLA